MHKHKTLNRHHIENFMSELKHLIYLLLSPGFMYTLITVIYQLIFTWSIYVYFKNTLHNGNN